MKITTLTNPRQTILVTCRYKDKDNIITMDWHTPLSFNPMMYAIAIGKKRFSCGLIKNSNAFVVNFMSKDYEKEILFCGRNSGRDYDASTGLSVNPEQRRRVDKFKETGFQKEEAEGIDCPRIKQVLGFLECKVVREVEVGDHILFIAKVVNSSLKKKGKRLFHLWGDKFTTTEN